MMSEYYFTFRSLTQGQTAYHILNAHGIRAALIRAPKSLSQLGCSYALHLISQIPSKVLRILKDGGAAPVGTFRYDSAFNRPEAVLL